MGYIAQVEIDDNGPIPVTSSLYGTCNSASSEQNKTVLCNYFDSFVEGVTIRVKFFHENTAENITLNVNGTGAKQVAGSTSWKAEDIIEFTYDGVNWCSGGSGGQFTSSQASDLIYLVDSILPAAGVSF